jgi:3-deoxy-D-arabino-heptulosonate 7-phosphate (DAHP) synthase
MSLTVDPARLFVMAGPCVIESAEQCLAIGAHVKRVCDRLGLTYVFKASFDKANRSAGASFRGPGLAPAQAWTGVGSLIGPPCSARGRGPASVAAGSGATKS